MGKIDDREQDLLDLIKTRRSIRQFTSDPVPAEVLREIVHAGIWAPTGSNQQEVRFYVTTDPADIRALWTAKPHIKNPQAAILVYVDLSGEYYQNLRQRLHTLQLPLMDVGAACQNMLLTAHSFGLGACWLNISPHWDVFRGVFKRFVTRPSLRLSAAIFLGYPARIPDLATAKHGERPVQRGALESYLLELPPVSRVACVHSSARNEPNLGAQALTAGLRRALHEVLGDAPVGVLYMQDQYLLPYTSKLPWVKHMDRHEVWQRFRKEVNRARQGVLQANNTPAVAFGGLLSSYFKVPNRFARLFPRRQKELETPYSQPPLVEDPMFNIPASTSAILEYPTGCLEVNGEFRIAEHSRLLAFEEYVCRWANRLNHRLPYLFAPSTPLRAAGALQLLNWAQVVILDGSGTVADLYPHATINGLFSLALAKSLGAAAYSVNETVAVKDPVLSYLIKQVYNKIDGVIVREPMSKDRLVEIGVRPEKIAVGADCAILVDDFDEEKAEKIAERFGVGEGCIGLILRGDMSPDLAFWTSAINEIEARFARKVVFFSSCEVTDLGFGRLLKERLGTTVVEGMDDYSVFVPFLKRFGAIVTQRYHPIYFSIIVGVPFVPLLGNTFKAQGLLKHFDYPCPVLESPSVEQLVSALEQVLLNSDALRPHLARIHARLVELAWLNVSMLRKHA